LLYEYCEARQVAHRRCGKLLDATIAAELPRLDALLRHGLANGATELRRISAEQAREMEPALACVAAMHSPSSGIVDSHGLMTSLLGDAERAGALLVLLSPFESARRDGKRWLLHTGGAEPFEMSCRWLINAVGPGAQAVAGRMQDFPVAAIPAQHLAKGHYFALTGRSPFSRLIYPMPVDGGLGMHLTLDLSGQARFGPDVQWLPAGTAEATLDYRVDESRRDGFETDIRRYWAALPAGALQPAYTGVRPKFSGPADHGCEGVVQLLGIESPGLRASPAVAALEAELVIGQQVCP